MMEFWPYQGDRHKKKHSHHKQIEELAPVIFRALWYCAPYRSAMIEDSN